MKSSKSIIALSLSVMLCIISLFPVYAADTSRDTSEDIEAVSETTIAETSVEGAEEGQNTVPNDQENSGDNQKDPATEDTTSENADIDPEVSGENSTEISNENSSETAPEIEEDIPEESIDDLPEEAATESVTGEALEASVTFAGGTGTKSNPYVVKTAAQLNAIRDYLGSYFIQAANIDLSSFSNWVPIGKDQDNVFWGGYNGNGYTISNLKIKNNGSENYIGLFGYAGPEIKNLKLQNVSVIVDLNLCNNSIQIGTLAGDAPVINCSTSGSIKVTGTARYDCKIGGMTGVAQGIEDSHGDVSIVVDSSGSRDLAIGGLAGACYHGLITDSYSKGSISAKGNLIYAGGIVGQTDWYAGVNNCVSYVSISVNNEKSGSSIAGITGSMCTSSSPVEYCVNFGDINSSSKAAYASGIAWASDINVYSINNCYDLGDISGNSSSGRIYATSSWPDNTYANYAYNAAIVNGKVPTGGLLPSGYNGMNMSSSDIRSEVSNILTRCGCEWREPKTRIIFTPTVILSTSTYVYNGNVRRPNVTVKKGTTKLDSSNYSVSYSSGRKYPGVYKVTVKLKGNYFGSKTVSFKIIPKPTTVSKLIPGSKKVTVKWTKPSKMLTGYQIQYAADAKFTKNKKTVTVKSPSTLSKTITGLAGGKKCYVRIRTYKHISGKTYYSTWSKMKSVTIWE